MLESQKKAIKRIEQKLWIITSLFEAAKTQLEQGIQVSPNLIRELSDYMDGYWHTVQLASAEDWRELFSCPSCGEDRGHSAGCKLKDED